MFACEVCPETHFQQLTFYRRSEPELVEELRFSFRFNCELKAYMRGVSVWRSNGCVEMGLELTYHKLQLLKKEDTMRLLTSLP
jgi:hypothetical protein